MSFRLRYTPPPASRRVETDEIDEIDEAVYQLAEAGATAAVELDGYSLPLDGTGLAELRRHCQRLLEVLATGCPAPGDETLRAELPGVPRNALLHSWIFSSYMIQMPVIVFAIAGRTSSIYTRTRDEVEGWPLVVLEGRDLPEPVEVAAAEVEAQARGFVEATAKRAPRPGDGGAR